MGEKERIIERRRLVMIEKRMGKSLDEIHIWWNKTFPGLECSRSTIASDIRESLKKSVSETNLATLEWRELHIQRLEKVLSTESVQKKRDEADRVAMELVDLIIEKLSLCTGAYAPTKIAATDPTGENEAGQMSEIERATRLAELYAIAEHRRRMEALEKEINVEDLPEAERVPRQLTGN